MEEPQSSLNVLEKAFCSEIISLYICIFGKREGGEKKKRNNSANGGKSLPDVEALQDHMAMKKNLSCRQCGRCCSEEFDNIRWKISHKIGVNIKEIGANNNPVILRDTQEQDYSSKSK